MRLPWLISTQILVMSCCTGCALGEGSGEVVSQRLRLESCWDGPYDMLPDFFAGVPYRDSFQIRIQRGGDQAEMSDGLAIMVDDVNQIRAQLGLPIAVGLSPEVTPPGVPLTPDPNPPQVHMALYLHNTCREHVSTLHAIRGVITFEHLFNGDPNETNAGERLSSAAFDVTVADPRKQPAGGGPIPEQYLSRVTGWFQFYFERGQPGQPFP
ncbi:MAG TPA: hypothetical protein PLJ27_03550 [Polyangiaceae bacterium]|jgi:hypothetical protein|nr:MAG: hypothetical protein BWY17_02421 [Deltaproteobacteria bacterium ADurb.Bin207]HNS95955.1 hypothetical protein [Polyangiaceae bacterium]HNZ22634.1 hypothetical protein [Polyangiaceae bacterium]HOD21529.1 hypothetical protein [Polyangiaceae bacterium]HOE48367.1 hypothetical protein [Polyangiaceae bacterium]